MKKASAFLAVMTTLASFGAAPGVRAETDVTFGGDLRYRHELIDAENKEQRNRQRIRARVKMDADLGDGFKLGFQAASGSEDPISTNQTLTGGFSTKRVMLDLAFVSWKPAAVEGLELTGGKVKNPFHAPGKGELLWDGDLRPEGLSAAYHAGKGEFGFFATGSYFWIEERKQGGDSVLIGGQAGISYEKSGTSLLAGVGYFDYQGAEGYPAFFDGTDSAGNSTTAAGDYLYDYDELELFAELTPPVLDGCVSLFADYVVNIADDVDDNTGWFAGISAGKVKAPGSMAIKYSYRSLEKDAVVGAFTDSDFKGGGTDGSGHELNISRQLTARSKAELSYFLNSTAVDDGDDYHRFIADVSFKF